MKRKLVFMSALAALMLVVVGRAIADGIPTTTPFVYSGVLETSAGVPITTPQTMEVRLWKTASTTTSTDIACSTILGSQVTPDTRGRFQITLDPACFDAVRANPDLWVELRVGATTLPRSKINVTPFAAEAGKASRVVIAANGTRTTTDGIYCGGTPNTNGAFTAKAGALAGYRAAKYNCEQACSSSTAHMCSGEEIIRSFEVGISTPAGWIKGGIGNLAPYGSTQPLDLTDCDGWSIGVNSLNGRDKAGSYATALPIVAWQGCGNSQAILCCD